MFTNSSICSLKSIRWGESMRNILIRAQVLNSINKLIAIMTILLLDGL
jgi:hypothetical protein